LDGKTQSMSRDGNGTAALRGVPLPTRLLLIAAFLSFCGAGHAAGSASGTAPPAVWKDLASDGAACSVGAPVWSPWRDDNLCFPSRQKCQAWIAGLRRAYRRPEGFWTCLLLR
jgi:hypothetical protein